MISLIIDTSTERGLVALCRDEQVLKEIALPFGLQNSKSLFVALDTLFQECQLNKDQLNLIVCGQGPGSYTGLRVAAATAQSISYALKLPLVAVPTTIGFVSHEDTIFGVVIDAKISGVYFQKGKKTENIIEHFGDPEVVSLENLPAKIQNISTLVTPKMDILKKKIEGNYIWEEKELSAQPLIQAALKRFKNGNYSLESKMELLYLRKTQAELERLRGYQHPLND